jgi:hypothetical protein
MNFVGIPEDEDKVVRFINRDRVDEITCSIESKNVTLEPDRKHPRTKEVKTAVITLRISGGNVDVRFNQTADAQKWLREYFSVDVSFEPLKLPSRSARTQPLNI